jgi:hypothetical protein
METHQAYLKTSSTRVLGPQYNLVHNTLRNNMSNILLKL